MPAPYLQLISGTQEVCTTMVTVAGGQDVIPAYTPLMVDTSTGLFLIWDGTSSGEAVCLTSCTIDASVTVNAQVYKSGTFNIDVINWPSEPDSNGVTELTQAQKLAAFAGSAVSAQPLI